MKSYILLMALSVSLSPGFAQAESETVNRLLRDYAAQGAGAADVKQGGEMWQQVFRENGERSCASCHTNDLTQNGKHIKTRKLIKPMSPSVNSERLSNAKKVNKWFKRNCKWTIGRECTAQEKSNFLVYIQQSSKF